MSEILVIGSGLAGSVIARRHAENGDKVTILEERDHKGGSVYDFWHKGVLVQKYGPHIFHTSDEDVWDFVNKFSEWYGIEFEVKSDTKKGIIDLPFNLNTIEQAGLTLEEWKKELEDVLNPNNLEQKALNMIGRTLYELLVKGYSEKQWGMSCKNLPPEIIKRLPVRMDRNNSYYNDKYVSLPLNGYSEFIDNMLSHDNIKVFTDVREKDTIDESVKSKASRVYYSGRIEKIIDKFLPYRTVNFMYSEQDTGRVVTNYPDKDVKYTRLTVMNRMGRSSGGPTISIKEILHDYHDGVGNPYYPVTTSQNIEFHNYVKIALRNQYPKIIPIGRIGRYRFIDMDETISGSLRIQI